MAAVRAGNTRPAARIGGVESKGAHHGQSLQPGMDRRLQAPSAASVYHAHFGVTGEQGVVHEGVERRDGFLDGHTVQSSL